MSDSDREVKNRPDQPYLGMVEIPGWVLVVLVLAAVAPRMLGRWIEKNR